MLILQKVSSIPWNSGLASSCTMTIVNVKKQLKMIFLCHTATGLLHKLRRRVLFWDRKFKDLQANQWTSIKPQNGLIFFPKHVSPLSESTAPLHRALWKNRQGAGWHYEGRCDGCEKFQWNPYQQYLRSNKKPPRQAGGWKELAEKNMLAKKGPNTHGKNANHWFFSWMAKVLWPSRNGVLMLAIWQPGHEDSLCEVFEDTGLRMPRQSFFGSPIRHI